LTQTGPSHCDALDSTGTGTTTWLPSTPRWGRFLLPGRTRSLHRDLARDRLWHIASLRCFPAIRSLSKQSGPQTWEKRRVSVPDQCLRRATLSGRRHSSP